jgi:hypothetical protein
MPITTFKRVEKKFIVTKEQAGLMMPTVLNYMSPDKYCPDGKSYKLVNLYFDDDDDSIIRESVRKPKFKEKLRIRSYDVPKSEDSIVYIEIKRKFNGTVTKRRAGFPYAELMHYIRTGEHPKTDSYIYNQVLNEIDTFFIQHPCYPKVYISYDRTAYFAKDGSDTRLTFDENITTRRHDLDLLSGDYGDPLLPDGKMIMEIKFTGGMPLWFSRLASGMGLFRQPFSKYGKEFERHYKENYTSETDA